MQFRKNTSQGLSGGLLKIVIKIIIGIFIISILVLILNKIDLPAPVKNFKQEVPNEQFKIVK